MVRYLANPFKAVRAFSEASFAPNLLIVRTNEVQIIVKKKTKEARFGLRMTKEDKAAFDAAAAKLGLSLGSWLVLAGIEKVKRDSR